MQTKKLLLFLLFTASYTFSFSQQQPYTKHRLKVFAEIPVQFGIGYEYNISKRISANLQFGLLTAPNSTLILTTIEALGVSEATLLMIENAFQFGTVFEGGLNYNFKNNYVGAFVQQINLVGEETPYELVEEVMDVDLSSYPRIAGKAATSETTLVLKSNLTQAGVLYGRRFPFKNNKTEIDLEFGMSANVYSISSLQSDVRNLEALSVATDEYLSSTYSEYAFVPSIMVAFVQKLGTKK